MLEFLSPIADNSVRFWRENRANSILMLGDCVGEGLTLEVAFRYKFCKLVLASSFYCKVILQCALTEK